MKMHRPSGKIKNFVGTRLKNIKSMRNFPVIQPATIQLTSDKTSPPREATLKPSPLQVLSVTVDASVKSSNTYTSHMTVTPRSVDVMVPFALNSLITAIALAGERATMMLAAMQQILARQGGCISSSHGMRGAVTYSITPQMQKLKTAIDVVWYAMLRNKERNSGKYNSEPALKAM